MAGEGGRADAALLVAFWLLPAEPDEARLAALIRRLAAEHGAPLFDAHVSLDVARLGPDESADGILDRLTRSHAPAEAVAGPTQHGPDLFRSLYVPVRGKALEPLHEAARALCRHPDTTFQFLPHLSLMYKVVPEAVRIGLAATASLTGQRIVFDRVAAVCPAGGAADFSDIEGWRMLAMRRLRGC